MSIQLYVDHRNHPTKRQTTRNAIDKRYVYIHLHTYRLKGGKKGPFENTFSSTYE